MERDLEAEIGVVHGLVRTGRNCPVEGFLDAYYGLGKRAHDGSHACGNRGGNNYPVGGLDWCDAQHRLPNEQNRL